MEAAEETLTYRDVTALHRKLLPEDREKDKTDSKVQVTETKSDESNYVDLDMKPDGAKTVKVSFTSNGNQLSVIKCDTSKQGERGKGSRIISDDWVEEQPEDRRPTVPGPVSGESPLETLTKLPDADQDPESDKQRQTERAPSVCSDRARSESDELQYTDMCLNSKSESDDGVSAVLSDHCGSDIVEDESHYITTHEIQLTELDHDADYDLGRGACWDFEDDNLVYSFVDYTSFGHDETQEGTSIVEGRRQAKVQSNLGGAVVSTEQEESDLCDSDKCASSDESICKNQSVDANQGKFHLSIQTSSRAVNEPVQITDNCRSGYTKNFGDSHFSYASSGARSGPLCDRAQYFIPAPGRQHLATKLRRKDINEYSSGASSSISELDDADKEVRNLTAKSFRSLACPYFDAINLRTSSESSVSEYGLNKWSAYVDWNYGNISRGRERSVFAHKTTSATLEMKTVPSNRISRSNTGAKAPQSKMYELSKKTSQQASSCCKNIELKDSVQPKQREVTLNFCCNVEAPEGARRPKCSKNTSSDVTGTVLSRSGCDMQYAESMGDTHKRAIFASSLLKNVISKKMQFEKECKMERGEICDKNPALSCVVSDGLKERSLARGLQRQTSESSSGFIVNSADDQCLEGSRPNSCEPTAEQKSNKAPDHSEQKHEPPNAPVTQSLSSALNLAKEDENEAEPPAVSDAQTTRKEELDTNSMLTKLLFVPSCQLLSKKDFTQDLTTHIPTGPSACPQKCEKQFKTVNYGVGTEENKIGGESPNIKICLRNVKENKGCTLNIANLLTPKISYNTVNTFRPACDAKYHMLAADKVPNFTVRDIRDTKCKFQTPIYHVRDVRKLVKSSYRFVSLDNSDIKCSNEKPDAKTEPIKHLLPSPIVIKCHSVKTNAKSETPEASQKQVETGVPSETAQSESTPSHCMASRVPPSGSKQINYEPLDIQQNIETKVMKQRQDRLTCETAERRSEPPKPKQEAIEKLKAAVKTMEQLYDFDRNEWKRKAHASQPITDSHVLSLIASEKQGAEEATNSDRISRSPINTTEAGKPQDKGALNIIHVPYNSETFRTQSQQRKMFSNKSVLHFDHSNKAQISISSVNNSSPQRSALQTSSTMKCSKTLLPPLSVRSETPKRSQVEQGKVQISPTHPAASRGCTDYITIPGLGYTNEVKLLNREPVSREGNFSQSHSRGDSKTPEQKSSPLVMEFPATGIYHHAAGPQPQQHLLCLSPSFTTVSPTTSAGETAAQTQRKMLLDPTTGHYYLVDTPIQATTKRLLDPETGQYVDVPMPHSPVAPVTPVTPVPLSLSPLALSPRAYGPTYMIYPSFIPSPPIPAHTVLPQSLCHSEGGVGEKVKHTRGPRTDCNTTCAESTYYSATGETPQVQLPASLGHTRGGATSSERKPVISITTQQGPRIIAPPSFDGTTMSFVVEHR